MAKEQQNSVFLLFLFFLILGMSIISRGALAWVCQSSCGDVAVKYPFGTSFDCGSPTFQPYINCTNNRLTLFTPTGQYPIKQIDYDNNVLVIQDHTASTCSDMQKSSSFGLPISSPFSFAQSTTIVLLGCSTSNTNNAYCDSSSTQICSALFGCSDASDLGLSPSSPTSSCCLYSSSSYSTASPYQINLPLLQCSSYSAIYSFGSSGSGSGYYQNPSSWSYGIALRYSYDQSTPDYGTCQSCQQTNGICGYNSYGFVCICGNTFNSSNYCGTTSSNGFFFGIGGPSSRSPPLPFLLAGMSLLLGVIYSLL